MKRRTKETLVGAVVASTIVVVVGFLASCFLHLCWNAWQFAEQTWGWRWPL